MKNSLDIMIITLICYACILSRSFGFVFPANKISLRQPQSIRIIDNHKISSTRCNAYSSIIPVVPPQGLILSDWWIWSLLATSSSLGIVLEKTKIGAMLSANLVTMGLSLFMCNVGILPASSTVYSTITKFFVPLAVPLLLLDADLRKCFKTTGTMMKAFLVGAVGTIIGTFVAFYLVPMREIDGAYKIAAALCARHVCTSCLYVI